MTASITKQATTLRAKIARAPKTGSAAHRQMALRAVSDAIWLDRDGARESAAARLGRAQFHAQFI